MPPSAWIVICSSVANPAIASSTELSAISFIAGALFTAIISLFSGVTPDVVGPIGVFSVANQIGQGGVVYVLHLIGMISLNLAVLNILPFPALDGGRIAFLIIEKIKGSPVSPKVEGYVNAAGFSLLILLMVLITVKDITALL